MIFADGAKIEIILLVHTVTWLKSFSAILPRITKYYKRLGPFGIQSRSGTRRTRQVSLIILVATKRSDHVYSPLFSGSHRITHTAAIGSKEGTQKVDKREASCRSYVHFKLSIGQFPETVSGCLVMDH